MTTSSTRPPGSSLPLPRVLFIGRDLAGGGAERVQLQLTQAHAHASGGNLREFQSKRVVALSVAK